MDCYTEIIILYFFTKSVNILKEAFGEDGLSIFIHLITIYGSCLYSIPFPNKGCIFSKTRFVVQLKFVFEKISVAKFY
jgi:hypothetical protein